MFGQLSLTVKDTLTEINGNSQLLRIRVSLQRKDSLSQKVVLKGFGPLIFLPNV